MTYNPRNRTVAYPVFSDFLLDFVLICDRGIVLALS